MYVTNIATYRITLQFLRKKMEIKTNNMKKLLLMNKREKNTIDFFKCVKHYENNICQLLQDFLAYLCNFLQFMNV